MALKRHETIRAARAYSDINVAYERGEDPWQMIAVIVTRLQKGRMTDRLYQINETGTYSHMNRGMGIGS